MVNALGLVAAAASAFFNGSFGALSKVQPIERAGVSPLHFNFWVSVGLVLSSLPLLAFGKVFTPWGALSGVLFVASTFCTFVAIGKLGISVASAIWCGTAILASFIWGVRVGGDQLHSKGYAIPALLLLIGGLAGIAANGRYSEFIKDSEAQQQEADAARAEQEEEEGLIRRHSEERILDPMHNHEDFVERGPENYGLGVAAAVAAGCFGGLILAPKTFAGDVKGIAYVPSMAMGVLVAAPVMTLAAGLFTRRGRPAKQQVKVAAIYGIAAGVIWNLGNIASILATERVGLALAYPIMQCGLFVAGLWGILLFDELARQCIPAYLLSGAALVLGAAFLALAK